MAFRISDHELQTATGQYWLDILERIEKKDERIAELQADKDALQAERTEYKTALKSILDADGKDRDEAIDAAKQSKKEKRKAEIEAERVKLEEERERLRLESEALDNAPETKPARR